MNDIKLVSHDELLNSNNERKHSYLTALNNYIVDLNILAKCIAGASSIQDIPWYKEEIFTANNNVTQFTFVTLNDDTLIGYIEYNIHTGYIDYLYVDNKYRGCGYGKLLMHVAIFKLANSNRTITLNTHPLYTHAMQLYYSLGFKISAITCKNELTFCFTKVKEQEVIVYDHNGKEIIPFECKDRIIWIYLKSTDKLLDIFKYIDSSLFKDKYGFGYDTTVCYVITTDTIPNEVKELGYELLDVDMTLTF